MVEGRESAAANAYFEQTAEKRVLDKYAAHPELAPYKQALESAKTVGDETEVGTLTAFMDEVASRPSGATTDGTILLQKRRSLEDLLEVDLSACPARDHRGTDHQAGRAVQAP